MQTGFQGTRRAAASIAHRTSDKLASAPDANGWRDGVELNRITHLNGSSLSAADAAQIAIIASASRARFDRSRQCHF
jgi:hypothetical protein